MRSYLEVQKEVGPSRLHDEDIAGVDVPVIIWYLEHCLVRNRYNYSRCNQFFQNTNGLGNLIVTQFSEFHPHIAVVYNKDNVDEHATYLIRQLPALKKIFCDNFFESMREGEDPNAKEEI